MGIMSMLSRSGITDAIALYKTAERERLSNYLPWISYDEENSLYYNSDGTCGFMWECLPVFFAGESTINIMEGLFRTALPDSSVLQFILYADPNVDGILDNYRRIKVRKDPILNLVSENLVNFYRNGTFGLNQLKIPVRQFRLFVTVKFPEKEKESLNVPHLWTTINELLRGASLHPQPVNASDLLDWLRYYLNDAPSFNNRHYDDNIPIREQCLLGSHVERGFSRLKFDNKIFRCMTPKSFPREVSPMQINKLFGGIDGMVSDDNQITSPFLFSLNILLENQKNRIHTKCNLILRQQKVGSMAPSLMRKQEEHMWAADELERGTKFLRIIPTFWVHGTDEWKVSEALIRARRIWEVEGFVMQEDKGILIPLFISSLPMGLYNIGSNVSLLERHYVAPTDTISVTIPCQGDFCGFGQPVALFTGRKGQVFGTDIFSKSNNHNVFVAANSGAGKSFFINYNLENYYDMGHLIRIIDIGGSYKKATKLFKARFLDFQEDSLVNLNPFTNIVHPEHDVPVIAPIIAMMAFSAGASDPTEIDMNILKLAVRWAYENEGTEASIDTVDYFLSEFTNIYDSGSEEINDSARKLSFNLQNFTSKGIYGKYFNGPSNFNIASDEFVVLELEHLKPKHDLFRVVTTQVLNNVTMDLYNKIGDQRRIIVFEEAYQFMDGTSHLRKVIEEGYRRARKYGGSFWTVTQGILDTLSWGGVGDVILANSAYKFYMESDQFEKAKSLNLIDYDDFTMHILKSIKSNKPHYSEIFMDTPFGKGVGRLLVDKHSYYVFTSDSGEVSEIETMVEQGASYEDAINKMVEKYHS